MTSTLRTAYRSVVREVAKASIVPRKTRNPVILSSLRKLLETPRDEPQLEKFQYDMANAVTFMHSQRVHKELLDRYNPLHDLTAEERIKATARRVGLDMPVMGKEEGEHS